MTMSIRQSLMAFIAISTVAVTANATKPKAQPEAAFLPPPPAPHAFMSEEDYSKKLKEVRSATRRVADIDNVDEASALSDELKNIRAEIIGGDVWAKGQKTGQVKKGIQTAEEIPALIESLEKKYDTLPMDAKLAAAQIIAIKPYRSVVYRARKLIDDAEYTKALVITALRATASGQNVFFPTEQWKAGFDYLTTPSANMGTDINNEGQLQEFIRTEVLPAVQTLETRVRAMRFTTPVYFDNKMAYSTANFFSDDDRFALIGETERNTALAGLNFSISSIHYGLAYNWNGMFETADKMARVYGFRNGLSAVLPGDFVEGATAEKRNAVLKRNKSLFVLREGGAAWTTAAYPYFKEGVRFARLSWDAAKKDGSSNNNLNMLLDPRGVLPFTRQGDTALKNVENLTVGNGPTDAVFTSAVIGNESVKVNVYALFNKPPEDMKAFLPIDYQGGDRVIASEFARDKGGALKGGYRNYKFGSPAKWCTDACVGANGKEVNSYGTYFPGVKTPEEVRDAARILSQTWGGSAPFAGMLF